MFQFLCRFAFLSTFTFRLSNWIPRTSILTLYAYLATTVTLTPFSRPKEDKILIKNLYECKGYNARQLITVSG